MKLNSIDEVLNTKNLNTEGSIVVEDWDDLRRMSKDFYTAAPTLNAAELDNAHKCFSLAYLAFEFPDTMIGRMQREVEGPIIFRMVDRRYLECSVAA